MMMSNTNIVLMRGGRRTARAVPAAPPHTPRARRRVAERHYTTRMGLMAGLLSRAACAGAVVALVAASGCAVRGPKFASRFVTPGEPSVTYDDPAAPKPAPAPPLSDYVRKIRALQSVAKPKSSFLPTIESTDPGLSQALLLLAMRPSAEAHRQVAVAYRRAGVLDYAFRHFQRAAASSTCDAPSFDGMARLWRDWGMTDLALSDAYHALRCSPNSAEVHNTLGTIFESLGRQAAAKSAYEKAVALNPRAAFALQQSVLHRAHQGQPRGGEPVLPGRAQPRRQFRGRAQQPGADRGEGRGSRRCGAALARWNAVRVIALQRRRPAPQRGPLPEAAVVFDQACGAANLR